MTRWVRPIPLALLGLACAVTTGGTAPIHLPFDGQAFLAVEAPSHTIAMYPGDLDGDGRPDVVVTSYVSGCASNCPEEARVYLTRPDGSLALTATIACPDFNFDAKAVIADLTGDGLADLVVTTNQFSGGVLSASAVRLYPGDGAGHFGAPTVVASGAAAPMVVGAGDFDGDGKLDLVVLDRLAGAAWSILRNQGGSTFANFCAPDPTGRPSGWEQVLVGDVTGDGRPDVVALAFEGVDVFQVPAAGGVVTGLALGWNGDQRQLALGDLDGDGLTDIVRLTNSPAILLVDYRSLGGGNFAPPSFTEFYPRFGDFALVDLDGDGKAEILSRRLDEGFDDYAWPGAGPVPASTLVRTSGAVAAFAAADANGDGHPDLLVASAGDGVTNLELHENSGNGTFGARELACGAGPVALAIADLDGDGHPDIAVAAATGNEITVLYGDGSGAFGDVHHLPAGAHLTGLAAARLAAGGGVDLVTSEQTDQTVSVYRNLGGRTFAPRQSYAVGTDPEGVAVGDVTGDGISDLVSANRGFNTVSILAGDGAGGFGSRVDLPTGSGPRSPVIADLDGDGQPDLAYALELSGGIGVRLHGPQGLGAELPGLSAVKPRQLVVADLDHDGLPELISVGAAGTTFVVAHGDPADLWPILFNQPVGTNVTGVAVGDLDGDGSPDLAVTKVPSPAAAQSLALVYGGGAQLTPRFQLGLGLQSSALALGDLNGDGRPDLVAANASSNTISVLLNRSTGPLVGVPAGPTRGAALAIARLAPNPARGGVLAADLALPADGTVTARVVSLAGRALWSTTLAGRVGAQRLAIAAGTQLAPGVYWLDVTQGGLRVARKFVVLP